MPDLWFGFGPVIRVRALKPYDGRRDLFRRPIKVQTLSVLKARHEKAVDLLERRRQMWLEGKTDLTAIEKDIRSLGYEFRDEPDADDGRYSFWRK